MNSDVLLLDEAVQVNGIIVLLDFTLFGAAHVLNWNRETIRNASKCWQEVYPTRNKAIHFYNTPTLFNALWEIFKFFMNDKTKSRIHFHKDSLESLHNKVPKRLLPTEYGGEAGPFKNLIKSWKEHVVQHRTEITSYNQYGVCEEKRLNNDAATSEAIGSFRKLAVD
jgi:hypothetical protein